MMPGTNAHDTLRIACVCVCVRVCVCVCVCETAKITAWPMLSHLALDS